MAITGSGSACRSALRVFLTLLSLVALASPLVAQEAGGEANLKLPRLDDPAITFLGSMTGSSLLMGGLLVSALGLIFGLMIFMRLKNMPVHDSMRKTTSQPGKRQPNRAKSPYRIHEQST